MVSVFRNISLTIIFVLIIFTPPIRFLPYYTWLLALLGVWTITDRKFNQLIGFSCSSNHNFLFFLGFVIVFNCIITLIIHGFVDFSYIPLQIGIILTLFRNIFLIYCLHKFGRGDIFNQYCKYFFIACCIYVAFTLFFIVDPGFKQFWMDSILNAEDNFSGFGAYKFRYSLDGFAAFSSASAFSFACLLCSYLVASARKVSILQITCLMIMVIGCFFYGRVSLVGMLLGAVLIVWTTNSIYKTTKIFTIIVFFVFVMLAILNIASQSNEALLIWQEWAFSIVKQLFIEKEVTDYSVTHMVEDMYYMPDFSTIIFGDGFYTNPDETYYGHTDVGFMRLILYCGIFGLILSYSLLIYLSKMTVKTSKSLTFRRFIFLATILFFVLELKGESYHRAIMLLYPLYLVQMYKNNQHISCTYNPKFR